MIQIAAVVIFGLFGYIAFQTNFRDPGIDVVTLIVGIVAWFLFSHASGEKDDDPSTMVRKLSETLEEMEQKKAEEKKKARVRPLD